MFDLNLNYQSSVLLDGHNLTGIDSVSITANSSYDIRNILGAEMGSTFISGPTTQTMSLNRSLLYKDPILDYFEGNKPIAGSVFDLVNDTYYGFQSGYLKNYSVNCAVGSLPKVNCSLNIIDEMVSGYNENPPARVHNKIDVPTQGSITVTSEDFSDNRVIGFDYSIDVDHKLLYTIGSLSPTSLFQIKPIKYSASVQIELEKSNNIKSFDFLRSRQNKDVTLNIVGRRGKEIQSLTIPNASLIRNNLSHNADGVMRLNLGYIGHYGDGEIYLP